MDFIKKFFFLMQKVRIYLWRGHQHEVVNRSLPSTHEFRSRLFLPNANVWASNPGGLSPLLGMGTLGYAPKEL